MANQTKGWLVLLYDNSYWVILCQSQLDDYGHYYIWYKNLSLEIFKKSKYLVALLMFKSQSSQSF